MSAFGGKADIINGYVKGTVRANRVRLGGPGVVEGDILYRTLAIEENARFEGTSRRNEKAIDALSFVQKKRPESQTTPIEGNGMDSGSSDSLSPMS
jgi:cytoskeletal protein CcmA (bactofilin family)